MSEAICFNPTSLSLPSVPTPSSERGSSFAAEVLVSSWQDLDPPDGAVKLEPQVFFEKGDVREPLSLRFLCEAFERELSAVQQIARDRIQCTESQGRDSTVREDQPQPFFGQTRCFALHHSSV